MFANYFPASQQWILRGTGRKQWFLLFLHSSDWRISQVTAQCGDRTVTQLLFVPTENHRICTAQPCWSQVHTRYTTQLKHWAEHTCQCPGTSWALMQATRAVPSRPEPAVPNCPVTDSRSHSSSMFKKGWWTFYNYNHEHFLLYFWLSTSLTTAQKS